MNRRAWLRAAGAAAAAAWIWPAHAALPLAALLDRTSRAGALAQRAARLWLQLALGVDVPQQLRLLHETMQDVDGELTALPGRAPDGDSLVRVSRLADAWGLMRGPLKGQPAPEAAKPLSDAGEAAFNAALAAVKTIAAKLPDNAAMRTLEHSCRLRLESQRMARLFFEARIADTEVAANGALLRSREVVPQGLKELETGLDPALKPSFDLVKQQWFFLDQALKLPHGEADRAAVNVANASEGLLAAFDDLARKAAQRR